MPPKVTSLRERLNVPDTTSIGRFSGDVWRELQRKGIVPAERNYEEPSRGRVAYDGREEVFTLLADRCILRDKVLLKKIRAKMNLPFETVTGEDSHYRCATWLRGESRRALQQRTKPERAYALASVVRDGSPRYGRNLRGF